MISLRRLFKDSKYAFIGGLAVLVIGVSAIYLFGEVKVYHAKELIEAAKPHINTLCNTIILASATILALLFTVLGLTRSAGVKFKSAFYDRIRQIAVFDTCVFIITMIFFLLFNFPVPREESMPEVWFKSIYYATAISSTVVGSMMVMVILLLSQTIIDLIKILGSEESGDTMGDLVESNEDTGA